MNKATTFGQWLKQRRKVLGLTQKDLAQQVGCAEVTLRKIEAGDLHPSAPLAASLAKALGAADADLPGIVTFARSTSDEVAPAAHWGKPHRPHNLPIQLTPFFGREQDIAAVHKRLLTDGARLITLLGPPGVGKTRLAQAVAEDVLEHFEHGAFFVRLGPISDPTLVASTIAQTLDLQMSGSNPPALQLRAYLEEKHLLLVLDNFEQVIEAAPLVDDLLRRCPWLHILVTSRQPLRVRGERQMSVLPLALPAEMSGTSLTTAADVIRYPAVALFADRAEAVQHDFAVTDANASAVAELCRRLDGLPLAIELIAARIKLLPPAELLARLRGPWLLSADGLRDASARRKTLRGAIGWSYDLLTPTEQTLFACLAMFVSGCTLEAAEMMCGDDPISSPSLAYPQNRRATKSRSGAEWRISLSPAQVLDGIASLLDNSLLHREPGLHGEPRYGLLETVREYALERLDLSDQQAELRRRHASYFLRLIENDEQMDPDPVHIQLLRRIDDDIHNVRAALDWAMKQDVQAALLLATALLRWLSARGPLAEGQRLIDEVLPLPGASAHTIPRAKTLIRAGMLMLFNEDFGKAQVYAKECLALSQELEYDKGEADALLALGRIARSGWYDQDAGRHYLERALASYRTLGHPGGIAHALVVLSEIALIQGDFPQARALAKECLAVAQQAGFSYPWPLGILAILALGEGDLNGARLLNEQRLAAERLRGTKGSLVYALMQLGKVSTRQGDYTAAHTFLGEALALAKEFDQTWLGECYMNLAALVQAKGDYRQAIQLHQESLARLEHCPDLWGPYLLNLADLAEAVGQHELAAGLLGTTEAVDKSIQRLFPIERDDYTHLADAARAYLGAARYEAAWMQGRAQGFEQVAEEAVSILEASLRVRAQATPAS